MHPVDVVIIFAFVAYALYSGWSARDTASQSLDEYFLAGRSLRGWQAGLSMAATQFAADTPLVVMGTIATVGIFGLWQLWIYALAFLLMGFVLAPSWRRARVLTDAELTEMRYGSAPAAVLRAVKAIYFGTVFNCIVLAMVLFAASTVAEPFLLWHQWLPSGVHGLFVSLVQWVGVPLATGLPSEVDRWVLSANNLISVLAIVSVTTLYSTTGGLRSVVQTDVAQLGLMLAGTAAYAGWVVYAAGGFGPMLDALSAGVGDLSADELLAFTPGRARDAGYAVLAAFALQWLLQINADGTGYLAQRSMACRSDRDAQVASVWFTVTQVLLRSLLWLPIGLGLLVIFPIDVTLDPEVQLRVREATFVRGMGELLPPGVMGLMLAGMLAALASTVDTHLNWGASYWTNDIYARFVCRSWMKREPAGPELVWVARASNILILLVSLVTMTQLSSIRDTWQTSLLMGAGVGPMLVGRWLWWRINAWAEIASLAASLLAVPVVVALIPPDSYALRLLVMAAIATSAGVVAAFAAGPEDRELLERFYREVKPPGFWGPVAGDDGARRQLRSGLRAMGLWALAIFSLLLGVGSWMVGSPPPKWFPWPMLWIGLLLVVGILATVKAVAGQGPTAMVDRRR